MSVSANLVKETSSTELSETFTAYRFVEGLFQAIRCHDYEGGFHLHCQLFLHFPKAEDAVLTHRRHVRRDINIFSAKVYDRFPGCGSNAQSVWNYSCFKVNNGFVRCQCASLSLGHVGISRVRRSAVRGGTPCRALQNSSARCILYVISRITSDHFS